MNPIIFCIDAGHGQDSRRDGVLDTGAVGNGLRESDLTYALASSGVWVAETYYDGRIKVVLTRDSLTEPAPLSGRTAEAKREGAQYLVSVHLNSATPAATGIETFHRAGDAGDKWLAEVVQRSALAAFGLRDRGIKTEADSQHSTLAILRGSTIATPACLLEIGFITNPGDVAAVWGTDDRDKRIALWRGVFDAVLVREGATSERTEL